MASEQDHYAVLQVHPEAHPEVITAAYRRLAQLYHPDRDPSPEAHRRMSSINRAYEAVGNPASRAAYDRARRERERQQRQQDDLYRERQREQDAWDREQQRRQHAWNRRQDTGERRQSAREREQDRRERPQDDSSSQASRSSCSGCCGCIVIIALVIIIASMCGAVATAG